MPNACSKSSSQPARSSESFQNTRKPDSGEAGRQRDNGNLATSINNVSLDRDETSPSYKAGTASHPLLKSHPSRSAHRLNTSPQAHNSFRSTLVPNLIAFTIAADTKKPGTRPSAPSKSSSVKTGLRPGEVTHVQMTNGQGGKGTSRTAADTNKPCTRSSTRSKSSTDETRLLPVAHRSDRTMSGQGGKGTPQPEDPRKYGLADAILSIAIFSPAPGEHRNRWVLFLDRHGQGDLISGVTHNGGVWQYCEQRDLRPDRSPLHIRNVFIESIPGWSVPIYESDLRQMVINPALPGWASHFWVIDALETLELAGILHGFPQAVAELLAQENFPAFIH